MKTLISIWRMRGERRGEEGEKRRERRGGRGEYEDTDIHMEEGKDERGAQREREREREKRTEEGRCFSCSQMKWRRRK